jgi:hypothetical protein
MVVALTFQLRLAESIVVKVELVLLAGIRVVHEHFWNLF